MRFVKVFFLLGLLGLGIFGIDLVADGLRKQAPVIVIGGREEAAQFQSKMEAGLKSGGEAMEEAKRLNAGFRAELSSMVTLIYGLQAIFSVLLLLAATTLYLRSAPKRVTEEAA